MRFMRVGSSCLEASSGNVTAEPSLLGQYPYYFPGYKTRAP